ncbi:hypothetical protein F5Y18DRAFT_342063 [Xylariaceae sp. FL1019]|nr:hypothetical protein F5Y18DRAFT_342063 [Xylariaceae sp. FL1019]
MASPSPLEPSQAPPTSTSADQRQLLHSLNTLSLSTSPTNSGDCLSSATSSAPDARRNFTPERRRSPVSPNARLPSRSPSASRAPDLPSNGQSLLRKASTNSLRSANGATSKRAPSRRGSAAFLSPTSAKPPANGHVSYTGDVKEKPIPTATSVASDYFARELTLLHGDASERSAETIVLLHDDCYGHRFSRPRSSKTLLSTIVERPERIQASVLGVSMAYVRMGERHCDGNHPIHPDLDPATLPTIPFRIHKTARKVAITSTAVTNVHGTKWMHELKTMCDGAEAKLAANSNELRRLDVNQSPDAAAPAQLHQGDLYLCAESLNAFEGALGAVCEAVDVVFSKTPHKRAFVAVRPPGHHCSADFPSGFCWVNNVHVGIMHGILNHGLTHAAIIDFDLHHGDGSQAIAWQHNKRGLAKNAAAWKKTSIGYFSIHDINSYPCEYGDEDKVKNASLCIDNAHGQNIWNVHLQEWKSDVEFWKLYQSKYSILLEKTRNYLRSQTERFRASGQVPKAAIFLSAGFDASEWEGSGMQRHKVNVPTEFYARLTRDVVLIASEEGLGVDGRVISVLEGGYSDRALCTGVLSHVSGLAGTDPNFPKEEGSLSGLGHQTGSQIGSFSRRSTLNENELKSLKAFEFPYDPNWWSSTELDRFDAAKLPSQPEPKKPRNVAPGNYSSPTQSSNAKMTEVAKVRRSLSGLYSSQQTIVSRSPTPPPPDVPWTASALALSKLLVPYNRQVDSCSHSELNTEAMKARKERHSIQPILNQNTGDASVVSAAPTRMSLRERKPVSYLEDDESSSRRKTFGAQSVPSTPKASRGIPPQARQVSRRLSAASTLSTVPDISPYTAADSQTTSPGGPQALRLESSMSVRSQVPPSAKKGRPAAPPRKDSGRAPRAPRKVKPAATKAGPSTSTAESALPQWRSANAATVQSSNQHLPPVRPSASSNGDLEAITSGMRKIKINVLSKEQKEARAKAKDSKEKAAALSSQNENPSSASKLSSPMAEQPLPAPLTNESQNDPLQASIEDPAARSITPRVEADLPNLGNVTAQMTTQETTIPMPPTVTTPTEPSPTAPFMSSPFAPPQPDSLRDSDLFVPYQPDGPPANTVPIQGRIQILEPNTGTPAKANVNELPLIQASSVPVSPVRRGHGFTATSNIPFSPRPVQETRSMSRDNVPILAQPTPKPENNNVETWHVTEAPGNG